MLGYIHATMLIIGPIPLPLLKPTKPPNLD